MVYLWLGGIFNPLTYIWIILICFSHLLGSQGGGGGVLGISNDRDDNGGKNQNPKNSLVQNLTPKKYHAEFLSHKNFQKALNDKTRKIETLVLNTQKNPTYIKLPKKIYIIFQPPPPKKKFKKSKISNPKKSLDNHCHWKSRVPPWAWSNSASY